MLSFNTSVSFMKERLDQDSMGIILLQNFLKEFFPGEVRCILKCVAILDKELLLSHANYL